MVKFNIQNTLSAVLAAIVLAISLPVVVSANIFQAPLAQTRARELRGTIPGGQFAQIWLDLQQEEFGGTVTVYAEWDRPDALTNGLGFFIVAEDQLFRIPDEPLSSVAIAAGNPNFILNGPSNLQGARFNSNGMARYKLVVYNDSASDANFTLRAEGGFIIDSENRLTDPNAAPTVDTSTTVTETTTTTEPVASTEVTPTTAGAPIEPAASTEVSPTTTTTTTAPAASTTVTPSTTTAEPAPAPATTTTATREVRAEELRGEIQNEQHFYGLEPSQRDADITLRLTFDPQDNAELARRLNFWVLDEQGLTSFLNGTSPGEVAIAAGNRTFQGEVNVRVANFRGSGLGTYTVIVYNNSDVLGTYTLSVDGGILVDGSGQSLTAQAAGVSATTPVTGTATTTATTTTATTTTPAAAPATTTTVTGEPGGTYTVRAGDTLSIIARDVYGNIQLYQQLCAFNNIANCDVIEVGDVINLPTLAQLQSVQVASTTTTQTATPTATPAQPAVSTTTTTTTTAPAVSATVTTTTPTTPTTTTTPGTSRAVTSTQTTTTTTPTTTSTVTSTTSGAAGTIVDALEEDGRFTSLIQALQATSLDSVLSGDGPFTLFAPTDAAFNALPAGAFEQLLDDPGGQLSDILRYHVVMGETLAADISNGGQATTAQGKPVRFEVQGSTIKINGANVIASDIESENGVVHVIDAVILPPPD